MLTFEQHFRNLAAVDHAIRSGQRPTLTGLADLLGVNARTVGRYIRWLKTTLNAPIEAPHAVGGYHYAKPFDFDKALLAWLHSM